MAMSFALPVCNYCTKKKKKKKETVDVFRNCREYEFESIDSLLFFFVGYRYFSQ